MPEAQVRTQYNQMAAMYDQFWQSYLAATLTFLQGWTQLQAQQSVLDVACGTGAFEHLILAEQPAQQMVGVDIAPNMLKVATHKCAAYPAVRFQQARASALPFAAHTFDVIVSASAFHYFDQPAATLCEMKRVLKPEGTIVILDWCKDFLLCRLCDMFLHVLDPAHKHCYTQAELHSLLVQNDCVVQRAQKVRFGWVWGLMVVAATP